MNINDPEQIRAKLEAGRATVAGRLRQLADQIETLPLEGATEVLTWIGDHIDRLMAEADRILGAQPGRRQT